MSIREIKDKLIEKINELEDPQLLETLYRILSAETEEELYQLSDTQISALEDAKELYKKGETFANIKADQEVEETYISEMLASGEFKNEAEVIREALKFRALYREKQLRELRKEIELGWDGPDSSRSMDQIIESKGNY